MGMLASTFRIDCDEAMLEGYWIALEFITIDDFVFAAREAMQKHEWMPSAATLRTISLKPATERRLEREWEELRLRHEQERLDATPPGLLDDYLRRTRA